MTFPRQFLPIVCAGLTATAELMSADRPGMSNEEGQELAAKLRSTRPIENLNLNAVMKIHDSNWRTPASKVPLRHQFIEEGRTWRFIYQTEANPNAPGEELAIIHTEGEPNRYLLTRHGDPGGTRILTGDDTMVPFAGSDFWVADLGLEFLHWPEQRVDTEARITMRKSRPCKVLESYNPRPGASGYVRVRSWIDAENGGVIVADAYGPDNRKLKVFEVKKVTKVNDVWEIKNLEMRNEKADTQTVLEFDYKQYADE